MQTQDREFMLNAISEAAKCQAEDNRIHPKVGVVVVKDGKIAASAHRGEIASGEHAEYTALEKKLRTAALAGATVYTTLEPCTTRNHPKVPCADRLIERRVTRVVIGMLDPNQNICGRGLRRLREANVQTDLFPHDLMAQVEEQNREFTRQQRQSDNQRIEKVSRWKIKTIVMTVITCVVVFIFYKYTLLERKQRQTEELFEKHTRLLDTKVRMLEDRIKELESFSDSKNKQVEVLRLHKNDIFYFPYNEDHSIEITEFDNSKEVKVQFNLKGIKKNESLQINKTRSFPIGDIEYNFILNRISFDERPIAEFYVVIKNKRRK